MQPKLSSGDPSELLVWDQREPCPYLPGRVARMPMRMPLCALDGRETDASLAHGDRRHGRMLYAPSCPACSECQAIRLDVGRFREGRTHRRVLRRGDASLEVQVGEPAFSEERLALYHEHKRGRALLTAGSGRLDAEGYRRFLVDRCVPSFELRYVLRGALVGVAVVDRGTSSLSAVYCYFDPRQSKLSLGTYSILKQVALCRAWGLRHLYLGLYIGANPHMSYKGRFLPHERLIAGRWRTFDASPSLR